MADEVTYARIVIRGRDVYGIDEAGAETLLLDGTDLPLPLIYERADTFAWKSGVTLEINPEN